MNSNQIRCFLTVVQCHSFSRASELLFLTQPGVSKQIAALEKEIGETLLVRRPHQSVELTPVGEVYYEFFRKTYAEYQTVKKKAAVSGSQLKGELRLGILSGWNVFPAIQSQVDAMRGQCPNVDITLSFYDPEPLREALLKGVLDGIITLEDSLQNCSSLEQISLGEVERMLFVSKRHPVVLEKEFPEVEDFEDSVFYILSDKTFDSEQFVRNHLKTYQIHPRIQLVPNVEYALACAHNGMGVAIIDAWSREMGNTSLCHIPLNSYTHAVLAWNQERQSEAWKQFIHFFTDRTDEV